MSKAKSVLIRFHTDHANEKAAYTKLAALQEQTHLSQSQIVIAALNAYDANGHDMEEHLVQQLTDSVTEAVKQMLPDAIADCLAVLTNGAVTNIPGTIGQETAPIQPAPVEPMAAVPAPAEDDEQGYNGLDWDFIGG